MKAVIQEIYGPPSVVKYLDVDKPTPTKNQVLIKVYATSVNRTDCGFRSGKPYIVRLFSGLFKPKQQILGNEFSGEVVGLGKDVKMYAVGDLLFGLTTDVFGGHAEYICLDENGPMALKPSIIPHEEAAGLCEGHFYAMNYLKAMKLKKGDNILINGASGAIGSAAVQLAKYFGAYVTAVIGTENVPLAKDLGADKVYDYKTQDFTLDNEQYDYILDAVGKSSFFKCKKLMKKSALYASTEFGYMLQNPFLALLTPIFSKRKVIFPLPKESREDILFFKGLIEKGDIRAVVDRHYSLNEVASAYEYVETGEKTGAVVINVADN